MTAAMNSNCAEVCFFRSPAGLKGTNSLTNYTLRRKAKPQRYQSQWGLAGGAKWSKRMRARLPK